MVLCHQALALALSNYLNRALPQHRWQKQRQWAHAPLVPFDAFYLPRHCHRQDYYCQESSRDGSSLPKSPRHHIIIVGLFHPGSFALSVEPWLPLYKMWIVLGSPMSCGNNKGFIFLFGIALLFLTLSRCKQSTGQAVNSQAAKETLRSKFESLFVCRVLHLGEVGKAGVAFTLMLLAPQMCQIEC